MAKKYIECKNCGCKRHTECGCIKELTKGSRKYKKKQREREAQ